MLKQWLVSANEQGDVPTLEPVVEREDEKLEIVDISVLNEFRTSQRPDKPDLVNKLINLFIEGAGKNLSVLRNAMRTADLAAIRREAHIIKGSTRTIGAHQMAALCLELEQKAHLKNDAEIIISKLEKGFKQVVEVLDTLRR